jgi:hypothetical protein
MANVEIECLRCKAKMEEGFVLDRSNLYNVSAFQPPSWVAGPRLKPPVISNLFKDPAGLFRGPAGDRQQRPITCYRCTACGYLQNFAC